MIISKHIKGYLLRKRNEHTLSSALLQTLVTVSKTIDDVSISNHSSRSSLAPNLEPQVSPNANPNPSHNPSRNPDP